mgnify:CR=1 FL=1
MYDIISKTVSRLSGELSSKFVDVAEENIFDETTVAEKSDVFDREAEPSSIVENIVKPEISQIGSVTSENQVSISSGYSVIKN